MVPSAPLPARHVNLASSARTVKPRRNDNDRLFAREMEHIAMREVPHVLLTVRGQQSFAGSVGTRRSEAGPSV